MSESGGGHAPQGVSATEVVARDSLVPQDNVVDCCIGCPEGGVCLAGLNSAHWVMEQTPECALKVLDVNSLRWEGGGDGTPDGTEACAIFCSMQVGPDMGPEWVGPVM
jgi:hypothetical protein